MKTLGILQKDQGILEQPCTILVDFCKTHQWFSLNTRETVGVFMKTPMKTQVYQKQQEIL